MAELDGEAISYDELLEAVRAGRPAAMVMFGDEAMLTWARLEPCAEAARQALSTAEGQVAFLQALHEKHRHLFP